MSQYIYLLQEREFTKTIENVYKVGMTKKENYERFNQYPKGSVLLFQMICNDCKNIEKQVIKLFKHHFKLRKDIGNEYFEGDYKIMTDIIYSTIKNEKADDCGNIEHESKCNENIVDENIVDENIVDENIVYDEEEKEEVVYEITTYEEWIKYNTISKIIITNKKGEGYLRFKGSLWREFYDKNRFDFDETYMEDLSGFVEHNQPDVMKIASPINNLLSVTEMFNMKYTYKNKATNEIINWEEHNKLDKKEYECYDFVKQDIYKFIDVKYNVDKIVQDIIKKCYVKDCDFYNLEYHEYTFSRNSSVNYSSSQYVIFNSVNFTFIPVDNLIDDKILTNHSGGRIIYVKNTVNVDIVDDILNSLIANKKIKLQYKKLAYNLIVKHEEKQIFYDYNDCIFTTWITDLLYSISGKKLYINSCDYYDEKITFKKKLKTHKYRCVVIHEYKNISLEKQIQQFSELGFKNIIVCKKDKLNTMYNIEKFEKYLEDNKEIIIKCIKEENNYEPDSDTRYCADDYIFYRTDLLFTNFLKWCCTK